VFQLVLSGTHFFQLRHAFRRDASDRVNFTDKQICSPNFMATFISACRTMSPVAAFLSSAVGLKF